MENKNFESIMRPEQVRENKRQNSRSVGTSGVSYDITENGAAVKSEAQAMAQETHFGLVVYVGEENKRAKTGGTGIETTDHCWVMPYGTTKDDVIEILKTSPAPDRVLAEISCGIRMVHGVRAADEMCVYVDENYIGYAYSEWPGGELTAIEPELALTPDNSIAPNLVYFGNTDRPERPSRICSPEYGYIMPDGVRQHDILEAMRDNDPEQAIRDMGGERIERKGVGEDIYQRSKNVINIFKDTDGSAKWFSVGHNSIVYDLDSVRSCCDAYEKSLETGRTEAERHMPSGSDRTTVKTRQYKPDEICVSTDEQGRNIASLELSMATGEYVHTRGHRDSSKYKGCKGTIEFDIDSMTSADPKYPAATSEHTPVTIFKSTANDGAAAGNVWFELDLKAIANKSFDAEQNDIGNEKPDHDDPNRNKIRVKQTYPVSSYNIPAVESGDVKNKIAKIAAQSYLLESGGTAGDNLGIDAYPKGVIDDVSKRFCDTYNSFIKAAVTNGCPTGIQAKSSDGRPIVQNGEPVMVEGTAFQPLKQYGVKIVTMDDGSLVLTTKEPYNPAMAKMKMSRDGKPTLGNALKAMNEAFNIKWQETINSAYPESEAANSKNIKAARDLGLMIGLESCATGAYHGGEMLDDLGFIRPSIKAEMHPDADALAKSVNIMNHGFAMKIGGQIIRDANLDQSYGAKVIENVNDILKYGAKDAQSREAAMGFHREHLNDIYKEINGKDLPNIGPNDEFHK